VLLKLYFERYSFRLHLTKCLSHFLNKLMPNRNYFLSLSLVKKSFRCYVYILSRNPGKQLCNKATKSHKKPYWKRVRTRNIATLLVTVTVNRPKAVLFLNFNCTKTFNCTKIFNNTKIIIRLRLNDYGEYSPRLWWMVNMVNIHHIHVSVNIHR
jgi:hypothetical protein